MRTNAEGVCARGLSANGDRAVTVVRLRASAGDAMQANVKSFCETGTLSYSLDAATAALRSSVSNMRVVTAQAFGPRSAAGGGSEPERNRREVTAETWSVDRDSFDPTSLQLMQSVGEAYRAQKDRIIECLNENPTETPF